MKIRHLSLSLASLFATACGPNVVSSGAPDAGQKAPVDAGTPADAGTESNPYPAGPYGVHVNSVIQDFVLPGYLATGDTVATSTLPLDPSLDLEAIRNQVDESGKPFRYLLLDISAGWCNPCNQESQDLGLMGSNSNLIPMWRSEGGLFMTVLVEGDNEQTEAAPQLSDLTTWIDTHDVQFTMGYDPMQVLIAQGITPSAFPTNLVIDLQTMQIVDAWAGLDTSYQKWVAVLNGQ